MLRTIPGAGWVAAPLPGRGLLRRALALLVLLILLGLLLDALMGEGERERRLPVLVVSSKRTPAIAAHIRAAQAAGKPAVLHRSCHDPGIAGRGRVGAGAARAAATSTRSPPPMRVGRAGPASPTCPCGSSAARAAT
jgi:hypothetical protein